ncbi:MAG: DUF2752 domain-containing protein [Myxococcota bacterium]
MSRNREAISARTRVVVDGKASGAIASGAIASIPRAPTRGYSPSMRALTAIEDLLRKPWFGDASLLVACAAILVAAALMSPSTETLTLFGHPIPVMCTFRRLTGWSCPGCGLTRSFVFLAHGRFAAAWVMNPLGPFGFAWVIAQIPYRAYRISQRRRRALAA